MFLRTSVFSIGLLFSIASNANVVMTGSRIIYPEGKPFVNVTLKNKSNDVFMVQSWLESKQQGSNGIPFIALPPLIKLQSEQKSEIRIIHTDKENLPQDRESVFYYNFLQIPSSLAVSKASVGRNKIVLTVRHKVKLFYRPQKTQNYKRNWQDDFNVELVNYRDSLATLRFHNKQPLHVSLSNKITLEHQGLKWTSKAEMIAPYSYKDFTFKNVKFEEGNVASVNITVISDQGALKNKQYSIRF